MRKSYRGHQAREFLQSVSKKNLAFLEAHRWNTPFVLSILRFLQTSPSNRIDPSCKWEFLSRDWLFKDSLCSVSSHLDFWNFHDCMLTSSHPSTFDCCNLFLSVSYGPRQVKGRQYSDKAELNVEVKYAPFATIKRKKPGKVSCFSFRSLIKDHLHFRKENCASKVSTPS